MKKFSSILFAAVLFAAAVTSCKGGEENQKYEVVTLGCDAGENSVLLYGKLGPDVDPSRVTDAGFLISSNDRVPDDDCFGFSVPVSFSGEFSTEVDYANFYGERGVTYYYKTYIVRDAEETTGKIKSFSIPTLKVKGIKLNHTSYNGTVGDPDLVLKATVEPEDAGEKGVNWDSSDKNVATVTQGGRVHFLAKGETDIIAKTVDGGFEAKCHVKVRSACPSGAVDLGLSVYWAVKNVGASSETDYGNYYAWGEIKTKSDYSSSSYKFGDIYYDSPTKYSASDNLFELQGGDDVAAVELKGDWRMPTEAEYQELINKCTFKKSTRSGKNGIVVSGNGASIFFPASGARDSGTGLSGQGTYGHYWSSSLYSGYNYKPGVEFYFDYSASSPVPKTKNNHRYFGFSVRAVSD